MLSLASCERVIDLDVGENASLPVMSFRLNVDSGQILGTISQSVSYFSPEVPLPILDASVELIAPDGAVTTVPSQALSGFYVSQDVGEVFAEGAPARLEITLDGTTYAATNSAPNNILRLDSLEVLEVPDFGFGPPVPEDSLLLEYQIFCHFPATSASHNVLIEYFVNGEPEKNTIQVLKTTPNVEAIFPLGWNQRFFQPGEVVLVWAWTIPEASYDYWLALGNIAGSAGPGGVPGNPPNHWDQEALGHFTVGRLDVAQVAIPQ
jgi:hypothetical protein